MACCQSDDKPSPESMVMSICDANMPPPGHNELSHCGLVMLYGVMHHGNLVYIDLGNGLSPAQGHAIIWTNADLMIYQSKYNFHTQKLIWKCHLQNICHFVQASMS